MENIVPKRRVTLPEKPVAEQPPADDPAGETQPMTPRGLPVMSAKTEHVKQQMLSPSPPALDSDLLRRSASAESQFESQVDSQPMGNGDSQPLFQPSLEEEQVADDRVAHGGMMKPGCARIGPA